MKRWLAFLLIVVLVLELAVPTGQMLAAKELIQTDGRDGNVRTITQKLGELVPAVSANVYGAPVAEKATAGAQVTMAVYAQPDPPVLFPLPALTNLPTIEVAGTAARGSTIKVYLAPEGGLPVEAGETVAAEDYGPNVGMFKLNVPLQSEVEYQLMATAEINGETSEYTAPIHIVADRTPPAAPGNIEWKNIGQSGIELQWEPPSIPDPNVPDAYMEDPTVDHYVVEKNKQQIATTKDRYYFEGNLGEMDMYTYGIRSVDKAGNKSEASTQRAATFHKNAVLIAKTPDNAEYHEAFWQPTLSKNGKVVAYVAFNPLQEPSQSSAYGVYVYDIPSGTTERIADMSGVAYRLDAEQLIDISPDGRYVAYVENSDNGRYNVAFYDRITKITDRMPKNFGSLPFSVSMSDDSQWITFSSTADDIVEGDTNEYSDVFLYNRVSKVLKRISVSVKGVQGNDASLQSVMTGNGRYAVFVSYAGNLVPGTTSDMNRLFLYDTSTGKLEYAPAVTGDDTEVSVWSPYPSVDGRYVLFTENKRLYILDRQTGRSENIITIAKQSNIGFKNPRLSGNGRYVSLEYYNYDPSGDTGPFGIFDSQWGAVRYDLVNKEFKRIGNRVSSTYDTSVSEDGAKVAFTVSRNEIYVACLEAANICDFTPQQEEKILRPSWSSSPQIHGGMPAVSGSFTMRAYSQTGAQLEAVVEYKAASANGTEFRMLVVPMAESAGVTGLFLAEAAVPAGAVEITAISIRLKNDPAVFKQMGSLPVKVAGRLKVTVQTEYPDALKGASVLLWSEEKKLGGSGKLSDSLDASIHLGEAVDYRLKLVDSSGRNLLEREGISVNSGDETNVTVAARPHAGLKVILLDASSAVAKQTVEFYDSQDQLLYSGKTDNSGNVAMWGAHFAGETIKIRVGDSLPYVPSDSSIMLQPGMNEKTVQMQRMASGFVKGKVTDDQGAPVKGAKVELFSQGKGIWQDTVTDEFGLYYISVDPGLCLISARVLERPFAKSADNRVIEVYSGYISENNMIVYPNESGTITIDAKFKRLDADWQQLDISSWRAAVHYRLVVKSPSGNVFANISNLRGNNIDVIAHAGDVVQVCMSGHEAGLTDHCDEVVLDEQANGKAEIRLEEKGRISGAIVGLSDVSGFLVAVYSKGNNQDYSFARYANLDPNGNFSTSVPRSGVYTVVISGQGTRRSLDVSLADGELKNMGAVTVSRSDSLFQGKPGNGLNNQELAAIAGDTVTVRGSYKLTGSEAVNAASLAIPIPTGVSLQEDSIMLNGVNASPLIHEGKVVIPIGRIDAGKDGAFSYRLKMGSSVSSDVQTSAMIEYRRGEAAEQNEEMLGSAFIRIGEVSLEAPERSLNHAIWVGGRAPAGHKVTVYADETIIGFAEATAGGLWYAQVTLPEKAPDSIWNEASRYRLTAQTESSGGFSRSQSVIASVDPNHVVVSRFTMRQTDGRIVSFDPAQGVARFPYVLVPGMAMYFQAEFNAPQRVSGVRITVGETDIPVRWDPKSNTYEAVVVASTQISTGVYVTYDIVPKEYQTRPIPTADDWEAARNGMSDFWRNAKYEIVTDEEAPPQWRTADEIANDGFHRSKPMKATFDLEGEQLPIYIRWSMKPVDKPSSGGSRGGIPYFNYSTHINETAGTMTMSATVPVSLLNPQQQKELTGQLGVAALKEHMLTVLEFAFPTGEQGTGVQKLAESAPSFSAKVLPGPIAGAAGVAGTLNKLRTYVTDSLDLAQYADDLIAFQDDVINSECHTATVNHYIQATDQLYEQATRDLIGRSVLTGASLVVGTLTLAIPPVGAFLLSGAFTAMGGIAKSGWQENLKQLKEDFEKDKKWRDDMAAAGVIDRCKKKDDDDDNKKKRRKDKDKVAEPTWIWDPSGYVYEAVPENRIEGVTATLLQQNIDTGKWQVWDSDWFGQQNPLTTDRNGKYGWDVPEGKWKVLYEKEGYLPAESAELLVLPPHFDVNIPMVSLEAPKVSVVDAVYGDGVQVAFTKYMLDASVAHSSITVETAAGDIIAGSVESIAPKIDAHGQSVAKRFRFLPDPADDKFKEGDSYTVKVGAQVLSYARVAMEASYAANGIVVKAANAAPADAAVDLKAAGGKRMIAVEWKHAEGADFKAYKLYWKPKLGGFAEFKEFTANQTFAVLEGLAHSTTYDVLLVTVGHNDVESAGLGTSVETLQEEALVMDTTAAGKVIGATVLAEQKVLSVKWTDPADSDLRKVLVSWKKEGDDRFSAQEYVDKGVQALRLENLTENTAYTIRLVTADIYWNESDPLLVTGRTLDAAAPGSVTSPVARGTNRSIEVNWTDPAEPDLKHILVSWRNASADEVFSSPIAVGKGIQQYVIGGLLQHTLYEIRLIAVDDSGNQSAGVTVSARTLSDDRRSPTQNGSSGEVPKQSIDPASTGDGSAVIEVSAEAKLWSGFGGRIALDIGSDTFESKQKLTVAESGEGITTPDWFNRYSSVFQLKLETESKGTSLYKPVKLTMKYDAVKHRDFDERKLGLYRQDENDPTKWHYVGGVFDSKTGTLAVSIRMLGTYAVMDYNPTFTDLNEHWSKRDVEVLISRQIVHGMQEGEFQPDLPITRAQFTKLLVEMTSAEGQYHITSNETAGQASFRDVPADAWHKPFIEAASQRGLVQGGDDGTFRPDDPLTREELAVLMVRALGLEPQAKQLEASGTESSFADGGMIAKWASVYVELARTEQLVEGVGEGIFAPKENASRAQGAVLIVRAMTKLGLIGN